MYERPSLQGRLRQQAFLLTKREPANALVFVRNSLYIHIRMTLAAIFNLTVIYYNRNLFIIRLFTRKFWKYARDFWKGSRDLVTEGADVTKLLTGIFNFEQRG